jgi:hypothetical protein
MGDSFLQISIDYLGGFHGCCGRSGFGRHERELSFDHRKSGVIDKVRFVVAARKSALGVEVQNGEDLLVHAVVRMPAA